MTQYKILSLINVVSVSALFAASVVSQPSDDDVLWSSPDFAITVRDVKWYMKSPISADGTYLWEHPEKVRRAITDLFTLRVLEVEADKAGAMTEEEKQWIASYRAAMETVSRHLRAQAMEMMESVDWEQAAIEHYLAHRDEFLVPEARTVRALLLRHDMRTEDEALALAAELAPQTLSQEEFLRVVSENTEDPAAGDGFMENVTRGQTVQPFEDAVFAMRSVGELSDPVVSEFGVHVAQLLDIRPERQQAFEEVKDQIEEEIKQKRWQEFNSYLRAEPERDPPPEVVEMADNIDALLQYANERYMAAEEERINGLKQNLPKP